METKSRERWTKDAVLQEAQQYNSKIEWITNSPNSYYKAKVKKWIDEASVHMKRPKSDKQKWTKDAVLQEANKYSNKKEWENASASSYNAARKNDWIDRVTQHMQRPVIHNKKWTKDTVIEEAKKYNNKKEWAYESGGSFCAAYKNDWVDEAALHMECNKSSAELEILSFVKQYYPNAKAKRFRNKDNSFSFKRLEIDVYIPELKKGIEFDGTYWHSVPGLKRARLHWKDEEIEHYHEIKDLFFKKQGIELLHIAENTWISSKKACFEAILMFMETL